MLGQRDERQVLDHGPAGHIDGRCHHRPRVRRNVRRLDGDVTDRDAGQRERAARVGNHAEHLEVREARHADHGAGKRRSVRRQRQANEPPRPQHDDVHIEVGPRTDLGPHLSVIARFQIDRLEPRRKGPDEVERIASRIIGVLYRDRDLDWRLGCLAQADPRPWDGRAVPTFHLAGHRGAVAQGRHDRHRCLAHRIPEAVGEPRNDHVTGD